MTRTNWVTTISRITGAVARDIMRFAANTPGLVTVSRLARRYGADDAWMRTWGGALGRRVAKLYRESAGREPQSAWDVTPRGTRRHHHKAYGRGSVALMLGLAEYLEKTGLAAKNGMRKIVADVA